MFNFIALQAKEKLIASLQSVEGGVVGGGAQEARLEELRLEREHVQAQLSAAAQQVTSLKTQLQVRPTQYMHHCEEGMLVPAGGGRPAQQRRRGSAGAAEGV